MGYTRPSIDLTRGALVLKAGQDLSGPESTHLNVVCARIFWFGRGMQVADGRICA